MDFKSYKTRLWIYLSAGSIGLFLAVPAFFDLVSNMGWDKTIQGYSVSVGYLCLTGFMLVFVPAVVIGEILRITFTDNMEINLYKIENRLTIYTLIGSIILFWQILGSYTFHFNYASWFSSIFRTGQPLVLFMLAFVPAFWIGETIQLTVKSYTQRKHHTSKQPIGLRGLTLMATVWPISGLLIIHSTLQRTHSWFYVVDITNVLGTHAVLTYGITILGVGCLQVLTSYGLVRGKAFAYKFGLGIPLMVLIINSIYGGLSLFVHLTGGYHDHVFYELFFGWLFGVGIVWVIVNWHYLRKPSVRAFLGQ